MDIIDTDMNAFGSRQWHKSWPWYALASWANVHHIDDSVQDCSNSIANALEILQSCTKPSTWNNDWLASRLRRPRFRSFLIFCFSQSVNHTTTQQDWYRFLCFCLIPISSPEHTLMFFIVVNGWTSCWPNNLLVIWDVLRLTWCYSNSYCSER